MQCIQVPRSRGNPQQCVAPFVLTSDPFVTSSPFREFRRPFALKPFFPALLDAGHTHSRGNPMRGIQVPWCRGNPQQWCSILKHLWWISKTSQQHPAKQLLGWYCSLKTLWSHFSGKAVPGNPITDKTDHGKPRNNKPILMAVSLPSNPTAW